MPETPLRDDSVTIACGVCGHRFAPSGRRVFCSAACRQAAWRDRHPVPLPALPARAPRLATVYECPVCSTRYLGEQRCEDCGVFCVRIGPGAACPQCDQPIAVADLLEAISAPVLPTEPHRQRRALSTGLVSTADVVMQHDRWVANPGSSPGGREG
jgi:hypothetical protein